MGWLFTLPPPQGAITEVPSRRPQPCWGTRDGQGDTRRQLASSKPSPQESKANTKPGACLDPPGLVPAEGNAERTRNAGHNHTPEPPPAPAFQSHLARGCPCPADGWGCMEPHRVSDFCREGLSQAVAPPGSAPGSTLHLFTCRLRADCRAEGGGETKSYGLSHTAWRRNPPDPLCKGQATQSIPQKAGGQRGLSPILP